MSDEVARLITALGSVEEPVRAEAAERLSRMSGEEVRAAAPALVEACGDASEQVREAACSALEEMGPPEVGSLDDLLSLLSAISAETAYWATTLLARLGSDAAAAVPALANTLECSPHQNVRQRAAWALGKIGPEAEAAREALQKASKADDSRLARLALRALEQIGP